MAAVAAEESRTVEASRLKEWWEKQQCFLKLDSMSRRGETGSSKLSLDPEFPGRFLLSDRNGQSTLKICETIMLTPCLILCYSCGHSDLRQPLKQILRTT